RPTSPPDWWLRPLRPALDSLVTNRPPSEAHILRAAPRDTSGHDTDSTPRRQRDVKPGKPRANGRAGHEKGSARLPGRGSGNCAEPICLSAHPTGCYTLRAESSGSRRSSTDHTRGEG